MASIHAGHAVVLQISEVADAERFEELVRSPAISVVDTWEQQYAALSDLRPAPSGALLDEPARWIYYPWRHALVKVLGPQSFRALRLDRNRNLVTTEEQDKLSRLRIGVVGLSSGHAVAHALAMSGFCGELRLTDFDELELSNLNRVPAGVFDLGVNKAVVAMRRIAELDPYLAVHEFTDGLTVSNVAGFLDGLDIVVEQCDSLEVKLQVREQAQALGIPVLMATSDRGLIDVERFDTDPGRAVFHGLMGDVSAQTMAGLSAAEKMPYVLRVFDAERISTRMGASMLEVGHSLSSWPQLAGEIAVGAATVAEAVRRIGLGVPLSSGRAQVDSGEVLDRIVDPGLNVPSSPDRSPSAPDDVVSTHGVEAVVAAAVRAPSGGNSQPWQIFSADNQVTIGIDPTRTSTMDIEFRGSATAIGAAVFNARVAAAAHGQLAEITYTEPGADTPLAATLRLTPGSDPDLARWHPAVLRRATNRRLGTGEPLHPDIAASLTLLTQQHRARLHIATERDEIDRIAKLFAAADRLRYLDARLHREMTSEMRWPGDSDPDFGIDVRSLELDRGALAALALLRRGDVMASLDSWDGGAILGEDTRRRLTSSSALATVLIQGRSLSDFARGGAAVAALWTATQERGLAVQPVSPPFVYAHNDTDLGELSAKNAAELGRLRDEFAALVGKRDDESLVLTVRISDAAPPSVSSRRSAVITNSKAKLID